MRGLHDFARAQAAGAHSHPTARLPDNHLESLDVRIPEARRHVVRVADLASKRRSLAADLAGSGHLVLLLNSERALYHINEPPIKRPADAPCGPVTPDLCVNAYVIGNKEYI